MAFNFPASPSNGDTYTANGFTYEWDGSKWIRKSPSTGAQGAQGHQGAAGAQGAQGATAAAGAQGAQGHQGHQGAAGAQGAQGHQGHQGAGGSAGAQGHQGHQGAAGAQGAQGNAGAQGAQGNAGAQGNQGSAGSATLSNNADNRVITGGSGTNLVGESGLTYDGSTLDITGSLTFTSAPAAAIAMPDNKRIYFGDGNDFYIGSNGSNGEFVGQVFVYDHMNFYDNVYLRLGNAQDLLIYHQGNHSYIIDNGTGDLKLRGSEAVKIEDTSSGKPMITCTKNFGTEIYHQGGSAVATAVVRLATTSSGVSITGQATATGNSAMYRAIESGGATVEIRCGGAEGYVGTTSNHKVSFITDSNRRWEISGAGHFIPYANDTYDIGSSSMRVRNVYTTDLQLSNEGKTNDVDGTWGNYTIQEGESDLFLINNRNGKKYKFNLTEVS